MTHNIALAPLFDFVGCFVCFTLFISVIQNVGGL